MLDAILNFFLCQPRRIVTAGKGLYRTGFFLIIAGLVGRVATAGVSVTASLAGHQLVESTLADIYPMLPTWWVPESMLGYSMGVGLMLLGVAVSMTGKRCLRLYA